ncbi:hypothetical protein ACFQ2B_40635 [Streptomyces stramineus]|uniref:Uncharacterized protein n=1 Tax=Streptomyces stramineus TaxID=173861 RepID=A0ABP3JUD8_9ACTN
MTTRAELARLGRRIVSGADKLHPAALAALVVVLLGLAYGVGLVLEPAVIAAVTALVAAVKAAAVLGAAGLAGRCAVRAAVHHFSRPGSRSPKEAHA